MSSGNWFRRSSACAGTRSHARRRVHDIETSRIDQGEDRRLLDASERSQRQGSSPITATAGPLRTLSRLTAHPHVDVVPCRGGVCRETELHSVAP
ncbi:MAG TPA: hypothetical protein VFJ97_14500 [Dermatophilaceae bacterium]|nr:hypothetical protein [Dermatophilaceae bacterium]